MELLFKYGLNVNLLETTDISYEGSITLENYKYPEPDEYMIKNGKILFFGFSLRYKIENFFNFQTDIDVTKFFISHGADIYSKACINDSQLNLIEYLIMNHIFKLYDVEEGIKVDYNNEYLMLIDYIFNYYSSLRNKYIIYMVHLRKKTVKENLVYHMSLKITINNTLMF